MSDKEDIVDVVIRDAQKNHHVNIDPNDPNIKALVSYALVVGQSMGYQEYKKIMELKAKKEVSNGTR